MLARNISQVMCNSFLMFLSSTLPAAPPLVLFCSRFYFGETIRIHFKFRPVTFTIFSFISSSFKSPSILLYGRTPRFFLIITTISGDPYSTSTFSFQHYVFPPIISTRRSPLVVFYKLFFYTHLFNYCCLVLTLCVFLPCKLIPAFLRLLVCSQLLLLARF